MAEKIVNVRRFKIVLTKEDIDDIKSAVLALPQVNVRYRGWDGLDRLAALKALIDSATEEK